MFESAAPHTSTKNGGFTAFQFLGQQILATIGPLIISYPIFRGVEAAIMDGPKDQPALWAWRWAATILPVATGLALGFFIQAASPFAYNVGRFVAIIPTLWFIKDFVSATAQFTFSGAVAESLADGGGLEMWLGGVFYSIGMIWSHRRRGEMK